MGRDVVYKRADDVIEIKVRNYATGQTLDKFKVKLSDKKAQIKVMELLKLKYGLKFAPEVSEEESINNQIKEATTIDYGEDFF